jgi:1-acyl-sn-glycerol-3-phosphate acyltransferase
MYYLVSLYHLFIFVAVSLFYFPLAVVVRVATGWFDRRLSFLHLTSTVWASCYTWLSPIWSVSVTGRKNADPEKAYMMVCNHQSMLDIPVIYRIFLHFKWVSKASLFKFPIIGWNLSLNRHIRLERTSTTSQRKMFRQCAEHLQNGSSIMIFPEGTRSRDGELRAFKEGAFLIALRQKADILPIVLDGSYKALPEKGFFPN